MNQWSYYIHVRRSADSITHLPAGGVGGSVSGRGGINDGFATVNTTCSDVAFSAATASSWVTFSRFSSFTYKRGIDLTHNYRDRLFYLTLSKKIFKTFIHFAIISLNDLMSILL